MNPRATCVESLSSLLVLLVLAGGAATAGAAEATRRPASIVIFGDSGYIPSYERLDADEPPLRSLGDYLAAEARDWLERNPTLDGFTPTPWTFESALGSHIAASGLYPVAWAMDETCRSAGCDFGVMLGDNIYPEGATLGTDGIDDQRRFGDMLDRPFGKLGAGTPDFAIYAMLGNHDWKHSREGALAQVQYLQQHPNFRMPGLFYRVVPPGFDGEVELFVVDTEMLLASTRVAKDRLDEQGNELQTDEVETWEAHVRPQTAEEREMVQWLGRSLAASTARWKLVFGHHALWSGGGSKYEKARSLRRLLLPALCRHADAYFAGDDHMLEVYTDACTAVEGAPAAPLPLLVSGAAGKYRPLHPAFMAQQSSNNPQLRNLWSKGSTWGFMWTRLAGETLQLRVFSTPADLSGRPVLEAQFEFPRRNGAAVR
ncbi:MAG TPA: metallophosphoesterase [Steroidobacteraceae bacterium]|nr:metallophosphoesterase [Steroidobacteraceae bacterium]